MLLIDALAMSVCCVLTLVVLSPLLFDGWTPRFVTVLVAAPIGLVVVAQRDVIVIARRNSSSWLQSWAVLSGRIRRLESVALRNRWPRRQALMLIGCAGLWGVGRATTADATRCWPSPGALSISAVAGMLQVGLGIEQGVFARFGSPTGLTANPVYFGALSAVDWWAPWRFVARGVRAGWSL